MIALAVPGKNRATFFFVSILGPIGNNRPNFDRVGKAKSKVARPCMSKHPVKNQDRHFSHSLKLQAVQTTTPHTFIDNK